MTSAITVGTADLLRLLAALQQTAVHKEDGNGSPWCGILLHCARDTDAPPGQREILAGTAGDGWVLGHTHIRCQGQWTRPTLWSIDDVRALIAAFHPKLKGNKHHVTAVELGPAGQVVVAEAEQDLLSRSGFRLQFTEKPLGDYPRQAWRLLSDVPLDTRPVDRTSGVPLQPRPRTDLAGATLGAFAAVSKIIGAPVEVYRYHQREPLLIQIGGVYRGYAAPAHYEETRDVARWPHATVHDPDLPPPPPRDGGGSVLKTGSGVIIKDGRADAAFIDLDEPISDFPAVEHDFEPLCQAATIVIETQFGGSSALAKAMKIAYPRAARLLEQLEDHGVVGPSRGSKARKVLAAPPDLPAVLAAIRGPEQPAAPDTEANPT
ncbi:DNA segregation ATPase FtsK/SpoIIIE, S-DNA-T family [Amycolatopsis tolypomycina]|uniref:DNA segregation ATPase FtsK/SpoIIIE, S-DNA-T family n=1 Tax=Amycolatopsis tolypomycina TaxID=208445 RepID=A0A1H4JAE9_9PSEU|nr:DNA translocase FtsK [Amycolatopsis tolypomycina]SEB43299.1 DNA segregation ATPase FtsK/SpoIIIE, S-DNA-T family [Amycolatopsis tolypomycina]